MRINRNLRLEDPALFAFRALPWFGETLWVERESAGFTPRRNDDDAVTGGTRGANHVRKRVLDVGACKAELARQARDRPRLPRHHLEQMFSEGHARVYTQEMLRLIVLLALAAAAACSTAANPVAPATSSAPYVQTDLLVGVGDTAVNGAKVTVKYTGWLYDTGRADGKGTQFDTHDNFQFVLGTGAVIAGWDRGVQGMRVGGQRRLIIPPDLAYGAAGSGASIPANATLIFDITLRLVASP